MRRLWMFALVALVGQINIAQAQNWVTIKGQVVFDSSKPAPKRKAIVATKDQATCNLDKDFNSEEWIVNPKNKGIKNVVVWLGPDAPGVVKFGAKDIHPSLAIPAKEVSIDQPCCRYEPHIVLAQVGQDFIIKNSAPIPHHTNWVSRNNGEAHKLTAQGYPLTIKALQAERFPIELSCSIHPRMKAWVRVFDHPYFTLTDEDGKFEIRNAPAGKIRIFYWQESAGFKDGAKGRNGDLIETPKDSDLGVIKFKVE